MRVLVPGTAARCCTCATTRSASGCIIAVVEIVHIAVVALDLIVDIVVGTAS